MFSLCPPLRGRGVSPSKVQVGGTPFPGPSGGVPPSQVQGVPHPRSRQGVPPSQVQVGGTPSQVQVGGGTPFPGPGGTPFPDPGGGGGGVTWEFPLKLSLFSNFQTIFFLL